MKSLFFTFGAPPEAVNNLGAIWLTGYSRRRDGRGELKLMVES
jgi:hypothetical protein